MSDEQVPPQAPPPGSLPPPPGSVPPPPPPPRRQPPAPGPMPPPPPGGPTGPMPSESGQGGPPASTSSGGGSVVWPAVGVYFGLAVLQVFVGFLGFNNAYAEMDPNGQSINGTVMAVLFSSPSLIALGLVIWMAIAIARAKRRAADPHSAVAGPGAPAAAVPVPPTPSGSGPARPPGSRTRLGVLIGSATFLITCAGPCFGPSLVAPIMTPEPIQSTSPDMPFTSSPGPELPSDPYPTYAPGASEPPDAPPGEAVQPTPEPLATP
ncbi:MAG: hypothetical protein QG597_2004 [Actinomycetota bacterium]|nr:hypothetical protein [Actinomycetota bacterium]